MHGIQRKLQEVGDFGVAQLLKFAQKEDFAVDRFELLNGAADPQAGFGGISFGRIRRGVSLAEERGAKSSFATMGAENLETNRVEISAEEGARFVASAGAHHAHERLLHPSPAFAHTL